MRFINETGKITGPEGDKKIGKALPLCAVFALKTRGAQVRPISCKNHDAVVACFSVHLRSRSHVAGLASSLCFSLRGVGS